MDALRAARKSAAIAEAQAAASGTNAALRMLQIRGNMDRACLECHRALFQYAPRILKVVNILLARYKL